VVKGTALANEWRQGDYTPLEFSEYLSIAADMIERTPSEVIFHRVTGTAAKDILLAPQWCSKKWAVLNGIEDELHRRNTRQGAKTDAPLEHGVQALSQDEPVTAEHSIAVASLV
jgi:radical SAM superfamily enzyme